MYKEKETDMRKVGKEKARKKPEENASKMYSKKKKRKQGEE